MSDDRDRDELAESIRNSREVRYETTGELARGGMGVVERVVDRPLARQVARKRLRDDSRGSDASRVLVREARVTAWLAHPNVVPVHDLDVDDAGDIFFTMRLVGGQTLEQLIKQRDVRTPVDWDEVLDQLDTMVRVCDALAFAHQRGVIHCDLKPANIMVGAFGEVYLMDWGVARLVAPLPGDSDADNDQFDGVVVGTPAYMAPEQAFGIPVDVRADVFAVGAVLYHLLTGRAPYTSDETGSAIGKARRVSVTPPGEIAPWIPPALERVVLTAMARLPEHRYPTIAALRSDLTRFIRGGAAFEADVFQAGDPIVLQGETGALAYIIESGRVRVEIDGEFVREMGPGEVFGEMAIIDSRPRSATVIAAETTTVRTISADELLGELGSMKPWLHALVTSLTRRMRDDGT